MAAHADAEEHVGRWVPSEVYWLPLDLEAEYTADDGTTQSSPLHGDLQLRVESLDAGIATLSIVRLGLRGAGIAVAETNTGRISLYARGGEGALRQADEKWLLESTFAVEVLYDLVVEQLGVEPVSEDQFETPREIFDAHINLVLLPGKPDDEGSAEWMVAEGIVDLFYRTGGLGVIHRITLQPVDLPMWRLPYAGGQLDRLRNLTCHTSLQKNVRSIRVRSVLFQTVAGGVTTGPNRAVQFAAAQTVWSKACIQFEVLPDLVIVNAQLVSSNSVNDIMNSHTPAADEITVFFANAAAPGGSVSNGNTALAKVVINDGLTVNNPRLLGHELGHILSGYHPGDAAPPQMLNTPTWWEGDYATVMEPLVPNTAVNSYHNCTNADNPALDLTGDLCCLSHDISNHFIRDFPEDQGSEPAVAPPGRNFYSMSHLWNRLTNTAGSFANGLPDHQNPARFDASGQPHTNYLFARIHVMNALRVRNASCTFYLKHPGAGGGAANIQSMGSIAVPATLTLAHPETISLAWTVPAGTPQHSCMFAVVASPAEPAVDVTALSFGALEAIVRTDNDWAQRNLFIINQLGARFSGGMPYAVWLPPLLIYAPDEGELSTTLTLRLHIQGTILPKEITLEIPGREVRTVFPDLTTAIRMETPIAPGKYVVLVAQVLIPGGTTPGDTFDLEIEPVLGDEIVLTGYAFQVRIELPPLFLADTLDVACAALQDYAALTGSSAADALWSLHRQLLAEMPASPARVASWLFMQQTLFSTLSAEIAEIDGESEFGVNDAYLAFIDYLNAGEDSMALQRYRDAMSKLQMLVWRLYRS